MKTHTEIAEHMIRLHGPRAHGWACEHAMANIGENPGRVEYWQAIAFEIERLQIIAMEEKE